jgi:transposase InsO family protein
VPVLAWKASDVGQERLKFAIRANSGKEEMKALCEEFGISRPTGYLWRARYRESERLSEVVEKSRRPQGIPHKTDSAKEQRVLELRQQYPDWGAAKLREVLKREDLDIPRITVHRILLRNGLVRERDRRRPATRRFEREAPNQLWQMDFKGMPEECKGCLPLSILDDHSRYLVGLFATAGTGGEAVQECVRQVFERDGLPEAMLVDHGIPWWNMQSTSGWTWLTVWLMKLGIRLYLSGYRHPQTQGKVERCHGSLESAMRKRPKPKEQDWQAWLNDFRHEYNFVRPHEALQMAVPASRWQPSRRAYEGDGKPWEYAHPELVRKVRQNGGIGLDGRVYFVSRAFIGEAVQLEYLEDSRVVVWFCRTAIREFDLRTGKSFPVDNKQLQRARSEGL